MPSFHSFLWASVTQGHTGKSWAGVVSRRRRSPGWRRGKVVKHKFRGHSYSFVYASAARSVSEFTTGMHTPFSPQKGSNKMCSMVGTCFRPAHTEYISEISSLRAPDVSLCLPLVVFFLHNGSISPSYTDTACLLHTSPPTHTKYEQTLSLCL